MHRFAAASVLALAMLFLGAGPASAHAGLTGSDPEDGSQLQTMPTSVSFTFSENVGNAFLAVTAPDGSQVQTSEVSAVDREISATLTDPDQRGTYSASYRIVSADGHPVAGTVTFTVLTGQEVTQVPVEATQESFFDRHLAHVMWGSLAGLAAIGLIIWPLRRRNDPNDA